MPQSSSSRKATKLPPIDHGYAWVIVGGARRSLHWPLPLPLPLHLLVSAMHVPCALCSPVAAVVLMLAGGVFRSHTMYFEPAMVRFNVTKSTMTLMYTGVYIVSLLLSVLLVSSIRCSYSRLLFSCTFTRTCAEPVTRVLFCFDARICFDRFTVQWKNRFSSSLHCIAPVLSTQWRSQGGGQPGICPPRAFGKL